MFETIKHYSNTLAILCCLTHFSLSSQIPFLYFFTQWHQLPSSSSYKPDLSSSVPVAKFPTKDSYGPIQGQGFTSASMNYDQSMRSQNVCKHPQESQCMCICVSGIPTGKCEKEKAIGIHCTLLPHNILQIKMSHLILFSLRKVIAAPARDMLCRV